MSLLFPCLSLLALTSVFLLSTFLPPPPSLQDILSVIAYGTPSIRRKALNLLLHYWPLPLPEVTHHASYTYGGRQDR